MASKFKLRNEHNIDQLSEMPSAADQQNNAGTSSSG
jgi:hypothetical protein